MEPARLTDGASQAPIAVADLFCGAGGLSEGFRQAGAHIVAGADLDPDACATFALNFPESRCITGDVRKRAVRERVLAASAGAGVVVGGPPCQAFSQVRNHTRLIDDPRNSLYREFVSIVGGLLPPAFMMENVPGLAQMGVLEQVLDDLALDGEYDVVPQVVDAVDFGVPQTRRRIVFQGIRRALGASPPRLEGTGASTVLALVRTGKGYDVQGKGEAGERLLGRLRDPDDAGVVSAAQALSDLRMLPAGRRSDVLALDELPEPESAYQSLMRKELDESLENVSLPRVNPDTVTRLCGIPPGGNYRDLREALRERYISGQRWGPDSGTGKLNRRHYYAYRRLHPDLWAWTLNTKGDSAYHYGPERSLSVREFARLQSFPDAFVFTSDSRRGELPGRINGGAAHSRYRQAGNAVPPLLAVAVGKELLATVRRTGHLGRCA